MIFVYLFYNKTNIIFDICSLDYHMIVYIALSPEEWKKKLF